MVVDHASVIVLINLVLMVMLIVFIILDHVLCPVDAVALKTTTTMITEQLTQ